MQHKLKTWPNYFADVQSGKSNFQLRKNDRNFQVGDTLILEEFLPQDNTYTGRSYKVTVTTILSDFIGLEEGFVIMGIKPARKRSVNSFVPPTPQEAYDYFFSLTNNGIYSAERTKDFIDHYTSNGWKVGGKAPMVDWKASANRFVRTNPPAYEIKQPKRLVV